MSCYNWERGEIRIPNSQWAKFRTNLLKEWNARQEKNLAEAKKAHAVLKAAGKGKRGENRISAMREALAKFAGGSLNDWGHFTAPTTVRWSGGFRIEDKNQEASDSYYRLTRLLLPQHRDAKLQGVPKKKDFPFVQLTKDARILLPDAQVTFCNSSKTVDWFVDENNRAVERANDHWFAHKLFGALERMQWTRNSGGTVVGNDEYNRDDCSVGGGGNYVTKRYGPIGQESLRRGW
jgi:hypothetical protein